MKEESKRALESIGMNLDQTLSRFVGNEALLIRFLRKFPDDQSFAKLVDAVGRDHAQDAFHEAHTLKGVAGNLGLGNLYERVGPVVELLRKGEMEQAKAVMPDIQSAYDAAIRVIHSLDEG